MAHTAMEAGKFKSVGCAGCLATQEATDFAVHLRRQRSAEGPSAERRWAFCSTQAFSWRRTAQPHPGEQSALL